MATKDILEIEAEIINFVVTSPLNMVEDLGSFHIYDKPIVGVASADDPFFDRLKEKEIVGPQHMSPKEWLESARSVIVYFLPFSKRVRESNRTGVHVSAEWLYGRIEGEAMNTALRTHLVQMFVNMGAKALAPVLDPRFKVADLRSNWSERHAAYIAGLGTFSLSRSLITRVGSAGRIGTLIVDFDIEPTRREYDESEEYCSKCGACILRCPPLAIDEKGKDNPVCSQYLDRVRVRFKPRYGCGKCQTGVPCESSIPKAR
jgi:epoxyqueuosine reductase QueG